MKDFIEFLLDFIKATAILMLFMLAFVVLNALIDRSNPCSNFSDTQDLCERG